MYAVFQSGGKQHRVSEGQTKFHAGTNVGCGRDHTLFALTDGKVKFEVKGPKNRKFISIVAE